MVVTVLQTAGVIHCAVAEEGQNTSTGLITVLHHIHQYTVGNRLTSPGGRLGGPTSPPHYYNVKQNLLNSVCINQRPEKRTTCGKPSGDVIHVVSPTPPQ